MNRIENIKKSIFMNVGIGLLFVGWGMGGLYYVSQGMTEKLARGVDVLTVSTIVILVSVFIFSGEKK